MLKHVLLACCLLTVAAAPAAETLKVGIYPSYPPLDMKDPATGALTGFDVALGNALAERMGVKLRWEETSFAQFIASVETGRIDLFLNGMNDTPEREKVISFVDYIKSGTQFMVRAADVGTYATPLDLCGRKVAGSRSTNLPGQVAAWSAAHCAALGRPAVIFLGADNNIDARSQLKQGRADAMAQDSLTIPYVQSQEPGVYRTVGKPFDVTVMGIGVPKHAVALQASLQKSLQSLIDDGTYSGLIERSGLPESSAVARSSLNGGH